MSSRSECGNKTRNKNIKNESVVSLNPSAINSSHATVSKSKSTQNVCCIQMANSKHLPFRFVHSNRSEMSFVELFSRSSCKSKYEKLKRQYHQKPKMSQEDHKWTLSLGEPQSPSSSSSTLLLLFFVCIFCHIVFAKLHRDSRPNTDRITIKNVKLFFDHINFE